MMQPGMLLQNRYLVVRQMGQGGFGATFEVDEGGTPKVLKVLHTNYPKAISLFQREAEVLSRLHHPGIPQVDSDGYFTLELDEKPNQLHCLVMEKIEGKNLQEWLKCNQFISELQARIWLQQITEILEKIHQQQYFHRDIKLSNIMLKPNGQLVLIDFGAVREVTETYLEKLDDKQVTGIHSPGYTPPEQADGEAVLQSDFFALARTFVHLLTGKHPLKFSKNPETGKLIWRDSAAQISESFADLIDYLMATFPGQRPQNAQIILQCLEGKQLPYVNQSTRLVFKKYPITKNKEAQEDTSLEQAGLEVLQKFKSGRVEKIEALVRAMQGGQALLSLIGDGCLLQDYPATSPLLALQTILDNIEQQGSLFNSHQGRVDCVSFSPDGQCLATAGENGTVKLWNLQGQQMAKLKGHQGSVRSVSFSPDGQCLATAGEDGIVKLWNLVGQQMAEFKAHFGYIRSGSFSPDGQLLATAGASGTIKLWNIEGQCIAEFKGHQGEVRSVTFSPNGQLVSSAGEDSIVRLWNILGQQIDELKWHQGSVRSVSFSPDGQLLATAGKNGIVRVWSLYKQTVTEYNAERNWVLSVSFSPDGQRLATAGSSGAVRLWNLKGQKIAEFQGHQGWVRSISFSPDGQLLASTGDDGAVRLWHMERLDELLARGCDCLKDYLTTHPQELEELEVCKSKFTSTEMISNLERANNFDRAIASSPSSAPVRSDDLDPKTAALLKRIEQQLEELYEPLSSLVLKSRRTWKDFIQNLQQLRGQHIVSVFPLHNEDELKLWLFWVDYIFMPQNNKFEKLLMTKAYLLEDGKMPNSYSDFLIHHRSWKREHQRWKEQDIPYSWHSITNWPEHFERDVLSTFDRLKAIHSMLLKELGGT